MSRYYNEDWQRRKSYLIRSLFHDIPNRVLSPVLEESVQSSQAQVNAESTQSSDSQPTEESYSSYEDQRISESEAVTSTESSVSEPIIADTGKITPLVRPYSPLPPLIIEVEPNKHDEREEFYTTLLLRMRKVYRKMFLEGKHISDDDFFESDTEQTSMETSGLNEDLEFTTGDNNLMETANIDKTGSCVADKNNGNSSDSDDFDLDEDSDYDMDEMGQESCASNGEAAYSQMTFKADIHVDGTPLPQVKPSPVYEEPRIDVLPAPDNKFSYKVTQSSVPETMYHDTTSSSRVSTLETTPILAYESSLDDETQSLERDRRQLELNGTPAHKKSHVEPIPSQIDEKTSFETEIPASGPQLEVVLGSDHEEIVISPILISRSRYKRPREATIGSKTVFQDNQEYIRIQSTTEAKDGLEDSHRDVEVNKNKEDSVFVLRFRRTIEERSLPIERNLTILEDNQDPDLTPSTEENGDHRKELEVMRTPRPDESRESIPIDATRFSTNVDGNCDQNILAPNVSDVTLASEDGVHVSAVQQKNSNDIDDVLALIFNTTPELIQLASSADTVVSSQKSSSRKRRFEESSAQTGDVSWSDLRDNFFVGTPKILKLCTCVGHNCF